MGNTGRANVRRHWVPPTAEWPERRLSSGKKPDESCLVETGKEAEGHLAPAVTDPFAGDTLCGLLVVRADDFAH
jgi:hypothetical protein